jgi:hypothetical protein
MKTQITNLKNEAFFEFLLSDIELSQILGGEGEFDGDPSAPNPFPQPIKV